VFYRTHFRSQKPPGTRTEKTLFKYGYSNFGRKQQNFEPMTRSKTTLQNMTILGDSVGLT
jgi:hypothetical protein